MPREYLPTPYNKRRRNLPSRKVPKKTRVYVKKTILSMAEQKQRTLGINVNVSTVPVVSRLTGIPIGDQANEREGNSVRLKSIKCRGEITIADNTNIMRVIFFRWHDTNPPVLNDVIRTADFTVFPWLAPYNHFTRTKYTIMFDRSFTMNDTDKKIKLFQFNKYFKNGLRINYDGAGINSLAVNNDIYVLYLSDSVLPGDPSFTLTTNLLYVDI